MRSGGCPNHPQHRCRSGIAVSPWDELETEGMNPLLVNHLGEMLLDAEVLEFNIQRIADQTGTLPAEVVKLLEELCTAGVDVRRGIEFICPYCDEYFRDDASPEGHFCEANDYNLVSPEEFESRPYFYRSSPPSRDIRWVVVIHGMNTRGTWQEEFAWGLSDSFGHSIPQYIYKYGLLRIGVLLRRVQRQEVRELAKKLRGLSKTLTGSHAGAKPDIVAHSFGTWLISHVLRDNPDIKVGRLILLGCIVKPDFDWQALVDRGQVEYILNHCAGRDIWVRASHFTIPDAGPGGQKGFASENLLNIRSDDYRHSDYFKKNRTREALSEGGTWRKFLTRPAQNLPDSFPNAFVADGWTAAPFWGRMVRVLLLMLIVVLSPLLALIVGTWTLVAEK